MSKVFVLERTKVDISDAKRYGTVEYVYEDNDRRLSIWDENYKWDTLDVLEHLGFNAERDYLLIAGNVVPMIIVATAMVSKYGRIQALLYSATERAYILRWLGLEEDTTHDDERATCRTV